MTPLNPVFLLAVLASTSAWSEDLWFFDKDKECLPLMLNGNKITLHEYLAIHKDCQIISSEKNEIKHQVYILGCEDLHGVFMILAKDLKACRRIPKIESDFRKALKNEK